VGHLGYFYNLAVVNSAAINFFWARNPYRLIINPEPMKWHFLTLKHNSNEANNEFFFFFGGTGVWTQGLMLARQVLPFESLCQPFIGWVVF
jgi:hypothetical protein